MHFLFNVLDTVMACRDDPAAIETLTQSLAEDLRFPLRSAATLEPLSRERDALEEYLAIQGLRWVAPGATTRRATAAWSRSRTSEKYDVTITLAYHPYATQRDAAPGNTIGSGANEANDEKGVDSVTQSATYSASQNHLADVGAFTNSTSDHGSFDQSGNAYQWNDLDGTAGSDRVLRGGSWHDGLASLVSSSNRFSHVPSFEFHDLGFRLAAVPEPASLGLAAKGSLAALGWLRLRRRRAAR